MVRLQGKRLIQVSKTWLRIICAKVIVMRKYQNLSLAVCHPEPKVRDLTLLRKDCQIPRCARNDRKRTACLRRFAIPNRNGLSSRTETVCHPEPKVRDLTLHRKDNRMR